MGISCHLTNMPRLFEPPRTVGILGCIVTHRSAASYDPLPLGAVS
jgi:hypothetical protein